MKKNLLKLAFWIGLFVSTYSSLFGNAEQITNPPLFEIKKNDKTSYLFGTIHMTPFKKLSSQIRQFLLQANSLVLEHSPFTTMDFKSCEAKEDNNWKEIITGDRNSKLGLFNNITARKIDFEVNNRCGVLFITYHYYDIISDLPKQDTIEYKLIELLSPFYVHGLETISEALALTGDLTSTTIDEMLDDLLQLTGNSDYLVSFKKEINSIYASYELEIDEFCQEEEEGPTDTIEGRNYLWIDRIENLHHTLPGPVLFVVGVGHLCGKGGLGLIELLRARKFEVTRVRVPHHDLEKTEL